jgi:hypothetical protein
MSGRLGIYSQVGNGSAPALPLLLDVYTGAAAAYSLRKIAVATTNVIRVRRSSDNAEQDFTAAQITDGTLLAFTGSGDGRVVTWYDQSGNSAHATQATLNRQPAIVLSGALVLDSSGVNPTLEFHVGNVGSILNAPLVSAQPLTLFNLRRYRAGGTVSRVAIGYAGANNSYSDSNIAGSFRSYYSSYIVQGANNTNRELFYSLANGASTAVSLNNGSEVVGNAGTAGASALTIGAAGLNFTPRVNEQEVIIYDSNQSSNKSGILTNINTHYNLYPEPNPQPTSGLLYDYPSAVAYSLRQLGVFPGGEVKVVRIRRSSDNALQDFNTTQITDGTLTTFTGSGDGFVDTWYDQSQSTNHATQATYTSQPKLVSAGSVILEGGKPTLEFDGDVLNASLSSSQPLTSFFVRRYRDNNAVYVGASVGGTDNGYVELVQSGQFKTYYSTALIQGTDNTNRGLWYSLANGTSSVAGLDGSTTTGNAGTTGASALTIGAAGTSYNAPINSQELIIYDSNESANRTAIEANINAYY